MVSQNAIPSFKLLGGHRPYVFTEHGAVMMASVLNTPRAIAMSIYVVRAFIKLKKFISNHKDWLYQKILDLEKNFSRHDTEIKTIFKILKNLMMTAETTSHEEPKRITGFSPNKK